MKILVQHSKPTLGKEERDAIQSVIKSGWVAQGKAVERFEDRLCEYIGLPCRQGVALSNGTTALYLALKLVGVKRGDEVIVPSYTCSAVLNAVCAAGAKPVLTDVDKNSFNISYKFIKEKITKKTKAIIVVHVFGVPADLELMSNFSVPIIEDCATALGSFMAQKHVGVSGDVAIFSFYASKVITTGQGGMLVSKNSGYIKKARDYRQFDGRKVYYPRFNFQMTDLQAAMGVAQLGKLGVFLRKRKTIARSYASICRKKGWRFQCPDNKDFIPNWHRFVLNIEAKTVTKLKSYLRKQGIETIVPIERWELLHRYLRLDRRLFKNSESISQATLSLPIYPGFVDESGFEKAIDIIDKF